MKSNTAKIQARLKWEVACERLSFVLDSPEGSSTEHLDLEEAACLVRGALEEARTVFGSDLEATAAFDSPHCIARLEDEGQDRGPRSALDLFTAAASDVGAIRPGDKLDQMMVEFALRIVNMAGAIGDNYLQPESSTGATVGDRIREELGVS